MCEEALLNTQYCTTRPNLLNRCFFLLSLRRPTTMMMMMMILHLINIKYCDLGLGLSSQQPPKRRNKRRRRDTSSSRKVEPIPPEDVIDEFRRKEILLAYKKSIVSCNKKRNETNKELPISYAKTPLKQLQLTGLKTDDIRKYFNDDSLEKLDADMFLRFAADKTMQLEKANKAFQLMDEAQKGVVVIEDLQRVCIELGEDLTEEELVEMIEFADSTGEGLLSPEHFFRIAHKVNL